MRRSFGLALVIDYSECNQAHDHASECLEEVRYVPRLTDAWRRWSRIFIITVVSIVKVIAITVVIHGVIIGAVVAVGIIIVGHLVIIVQFFRCSLGFQICVLLFICHWLWEIVDLSIAVVLPLLYSSILKISLALVLVSIILRVFLPFIVCLLLAHSSFQLIVVCSDTHLLTCPILALNGPIEHLFFAGRTCQGQRYHETENKLLLILLVFLHTFCLLFLNIINNLCNFF